MKATKTDQVVIAARALLPLCDVPPDGWMVEFEALEKSLNELGSAMHAGLAPSDDKNPLKDKDTVEENHTPRSAPWTPEPWHESAFHFFKAVAKSRGDAMVADFENRIFANPNEAKENLKRAITCVNALAGVAHPEKVKVLIGAASEDFGNERLQRVIASLYSPDLKPTPDDLSPKSDLPAAVKEVIKQATILCEVEFPSRKIRPLVEALDALGEHEKE